ncbi:MAG TPA: enoyl-CoA hydratase-related protein [Myxococcota bacterium]|jgi:enoyl-CoA hydratase|nr:enoyl-CoA hydratase-related protein [Myxococcota bacterium]
MREQADPASAPGASGGADDAVLLERRGAGGAVAWLVLNRPARLNPMSTELLAAFQARVAEVRADRSVRCVVVTGAGKGFCAGADLARLPEQIAQTGDPGAAGARAALRGIYQGFLCLLDLEVPTIAAVNGAAYGGGLGLAMLCDMRVAAAEARLAANFVKLGIHPGMALSYLLPTAVGYARAAEMLFTGRTLSGTDAAAAGLVNRAVPRDALAGEAQALADEVAAAAPLAVRLAKRTLRAAARFDPALALELEAWSQAATLGTADAAEGMGAALAKRPPRFTDR